MFVFLRSPIVVMILILCVSTDFFKNLANIHKYNIDQRISNVYSYCSNSSIGYLNFLKKKYKLNQNQEIINYKQTGPVKWAMTNTKNSFKNTDQLILLNYPGEIINFELRENDKKESLKRYDLNLQESVIRVNKFDIIQLLSNGYNSLLSNDKLISNVKDGAKGVEMLLATHISSKENRIVRFPLSEEKDNFTVPFT